MSLGWVRIEAEDDSPQKVVQGGLTLLLRMLEILGDIRAQARIMPSLRSSTLPALGLAESELRGWAI